MIAALCVAGVGLLPAAARASADAAPSPDRRAQLELAALLASQGLVDHAISILLADAWAHPNDAAAWRRLAAACKAAERPACVARARMELIVAEHSPPPPLRPPARDAAAPDLPGRGERSSKTPYVGRASVNVARVVAEQVVGGSIGYLLPFVAVGLMVGEPFALVPYRPAEGSIENTAASLFAILAIGPVASTTAAAGACLPAWTSMSVGNCPAAIGLALLAYWVAVLGVMETAEHELPQHLVVESATVGGAIAGSWLTPAIFGSLTGARVGPTLPVLTLRF